MKDFVILLAMLMALSVPALGQESSSDQPVAGFKGPEPTLTELQLKAQNLDFEYKLMQIRMREIPKEYQEIQEMIKAKTAKPEAPAEPKKEDGKKEKKK